MYDINGDPVEEADGFSLAGLIISLSMVLMLVASIFLANDSIKSRDTHDSLDATLTADGTYIKWYVFKDPDTGVEYLVNDRGGCILRSDQTNDF